MTNYTSTLGAHGAIETDVRPAGKSLWKRAMEALVAARQEQARRELERYFSTLSDAQRKDLGFPVAPPRH
jgi:hypothetical protein